MKTDKNKEITQNIRYNHLNLPVTIGIGANGIVYLYTATGQKLRKEVQIGSETITTDYLNGFQYVNESLQFFPTAEGYVNVSYCNECQETHQMKFNYVYNYTDHLGNIRMSYGWDNNDHVAKILEENHYYPFGLKHDNYNVQQLKYVEINPYETGYTLGEGKMKIAQINPAINNVMYKYRYNSKEFQDELGLNWYDYHARNYDPAIGRWMNVDPLAEKYFGATPYNYVLNNPINAIDPDGMDVYLLLESGKTILALKEKDKNTDTMYAVKNGFVNPITKEQSNSTIFDMKDTNGDGNFDKNDGITVKSGIIGQLTNSSGLINGDKVYTSKSNYSKQNEQDYFGLFKYLSDNSQAEFGLHTFNEKGKVSIRLVTERDTGEVPGPENFGIKQKDIIYTYHSHPGIRPNRSSEIYSIQGSTGDSDYGQSYYGKRNYPNYIYFPNSSKLYNVTPTSINYIKTINKAADLKTNQ